MNSDVLAPSGIKNTGDAALAPEDSPRSVRSSPPSEDDALVLAKYDAANARRRAAPGFLHVRADGTTARLCDSALLRDAHDAAFGKDCSHIIWAEDVTRTGHRRLCAWFQESVDGSPDDHATVCSELLDTLDIEFATTPAAVLLSRADGTVLSAHDMGKIERLHKRMKVCFDLDADYEKREAAAASGEDVSEPEYPEEETFSAFESLGSDAEDDVFI